MSELCKVHSIHISILKCESKESCSVICKTDCDCHYSAKLQNKVYTANNPKEYFSCPSPIQ